MDDRILVAALVAGDPRGLQDAYQHYADRLYTYCLDRLGDPGPATDALHQTFVLASQRAYRLAEPERLRCWLYALARHACRRIRRDRRRYRVSGSAGSGEPEPAGGAGIEPVTGLPVPELTELVRTAAAGLRPVDRELFWLAVRHQLPVAEIGELLDLPPAQVPAQLDRAEAQLARALAALLAELPGTGPAPDPAEVLSGYAAAPHQPPPDLLWPRLELNCFDPGFAPERAAIVRRAGRFARRTGFPRSPNPRRRRRAAVAGVAAVAVALLAAGAGTVLPDSEPRRDPPGGAAQATAAAGGPPNPRAEVSPTGSPSTRPSPTPTASTSPSTGPSSRSPAPPESTAPPPLAVQASGDSDCTRRLLFEDYYTIEVFATADRRLDTAQLVVAAGSDRQSYQLEVDGSDAAGETEPLRESEVTWWVEVIGSDQQSAGTDPVEVDSPC